MSSTTGILIMLLIGISGNAAFLLFVWLYNKHDLKKFERKLRREDQEANRWKFEYMLRTVRHFIYDKSPDMYKSAIRSINDVRVVYTGKIASMLDLLYSEVAMAGNFPADWEKIKTILDKLEKQFSQLRD